MSEMSPIIHELEKALGVIETEYPYTGYNTEGKTAPVITVASRGRAEGVNGWYLPAVWSDTTEDLLSVLADDAASSKDQPTKRAEFVIASEALATPEVAVSELARLLLQHRGYVRPVEQGKWYYSKRFEYFARNVGHSAGVDPNNPNKGSRLWEPSTSFRANVFFKVNWDVFDLTRGRTSERVKKGSRMRKWTCGCTVVRSATEVNAACESCGKSFAWGESLSDLATANFARADRGAWRRAVQRILPDGWLLPEWGRLVGCEACQEAMRHDNSAPLCNGNGPGTRNPDCSYYDTVWPPAVQAQVQAVPFNYPNTNP